MMQNSNLTYYYDHYTEDSIQKRILHSNLSDDDKIFLIEKLAVKETSPLHPQYPWQQPPVIYCSNKSADDEYLTERCYSTR